MRRDRAALKTTAINRIKWLAFPGFDLHTRCRYRFLPRFFLKGLVDTLDAGCGNGALSYAAYRLGNRVLGVTSNPDEVRRNRALFSTLQTDPDRLRFDVLNLYDLPSLRQKFDQIICSETIEHIAADHLIVKYFHDALKPGGVLHLCSPFAPHPVNNLGRKDVNEDGGHVRDGYTLDSYGSLLGPAGFRIDDCAGLGSPLLVALDERLRWVRNRAGDAAALPLFLVFLPFSRLDKLNPRVPLSLYVRAVKCAD